MSAPAELISAIQGDVLTPSDAGYSEAIQRWSTNAIRKSKLVVYPKTAEDVSAAIKYATANQLEIAIRGGGRSAAASSSTDSGISIDLSKYFNYARVDPDAEVAYVGGGSTWSVVNAETMKHGLATVGATVGKCFQTQFAVTYAEGPAS